MTEENKKKTAIKPLDVLWLILLSVLVYPTGTVFLTIVVSGRYFGKWVLSPFVPLAVLAAAIGWCIAMALWSGETARVKIYLTVTVLSFLASLLSCWVIVRSLSRIW